MLFKTGTGTGTGNYIEIVRRDYKDDHSYYQAILKIKAPALAAPALAAPALAAQALAAPSENKHAK
jgi:hypothetical protein